MAKRTQKQLVIAMATKLIGALMIQLARKQLTGSLATEIEKLVNSAKMLRDDIESVLE